MNIEQALRDHLVYLLEGGGAHRSLADAFRDVPIGVRGARPAGLPPSLWELLEHMRICQWDILEFSRDPEHVSPDWPAGYWPEGATPPSETAWDESLEALEGNLRQMVELVKSPGADFFTPFPWGDGQTLLREALLVADHNAYHVGQVVDARRLLGCWPPK